MNTLMWNSPVTLRHLRQLLEDRASGPIPAGWTLEDAPAVFARHAPKIILVPPQAKRLACGDVGVGRDGRGHRDRRGGASVVRTGITAGRTAMKRATGSSRTIPQTRPRTRRARLPESPRTH